MGLMEANQGVRGDLGAKQAESMLRVEPPEGIGCDGAFGCRGDQLSSHLLRGGGEPLPEHVVQELLGGDFVRRGFQAGQGCTSPTGGHVGDSTVG
jgi:hypothetical protein